MYLLSFIDISYFQTSERENYNNTELLSMVEHVYLYLSNENNENIYRSIRSDADERMASSMTPKGNRVSFK